MLTDPVVLNPVKDPKYFKTVKVAQGARQEIVFQLTDSNGVKASSSGVLSVVDAVLTTPVITANPASGFAGVEVSFTGADPGRYLRGIISKVYDQAELSLTAEFHLQNRLYLRDLSLGNLVAQEEEICQRCSTVQQQMWALIDRALNAPTTVDYNFWAMRSADTISGAPVAERASLYRSAAKRIAASYRAERLKKQSLLSRLARVLSE
jgi:hypothetical protein